MDGTEHAELTAMPRPPSPVLVLWTGPKHSGKTTALTELARRARRGRIPLTGILAPSVYRDHRLLRFDLVDAGTGQRCLLARRGTEGDEQVGQFALTADGLAFGRTVLAQSARSTGLCLVDEFGPLELAGRGWRQSVDSLLDRTSALVVMVVRQELVERVAELYRRRCPQILPCSHVGALDRVINLAHTK